MEIRGCDSDEVAAFRSNNPKRAGQNCKILKSAHLDVLVFCAQKLNLVAR